MYIVCNKCHVVNNKYRVTGHYEMNNKAYISLEFICKCRNIMTKHMLLKEYNKQFTFTE